MASREALLGEGEPEDGAVTTVLVEVEEVQTSEDLNLRLQSPHVTSNTINVYIAKVAPIQVHFDRSSERTKSSRKLKT
jgi:hypothetical protein